MGDYQAFYMLQISKQLAYNVNEDNKTLLKDGKEGMEVKKRGIVGYSGIL